MDGPGWRGPEREGGKTTALHRVAMAGERGMKALIGSVRHTVSLRLATGEGGRKAEKGPGRPPQRRKRPRREEGEREDRMTPSAEAAAALWLH